MAVTEEPGSPLGFMIPMDLKFSDFIFSEKMLMYDE